MLFVNVEYSEDMRSPYLKFDVLPSIRVAAPRQSNHNTLKGVHRKIFMATGAGTPRYPLPRATFVNSTLPVTFILRIETRTTSETQNNTIKIL